MEWDTLNNYLKRFLESFMSHHVLIQGWQDTLTQYDSVEPSVSAGFGETTFTALIRAFFQLWISSTGSCLACRSYNQVLQIIDCLWHGKHVYSLKVLIKEI